MQGIPEELTQQQPQQNRPRRSAPSAAAAAAAAATPTDTTGAAPAAPPAPARRAGGDDESMNLFDLAAQQGVGGARGSGGSDAAAAAVPGLGDLGNLDFLRNNPQFQQLRQVVQQQPQMLEPILQQLGAGNPQLAQLIAQHPEQFLQLLGEDADDDVPLPPGVQPISVTEEERDAIERVSVKRLQEHKKGRLIVY